MLLVIVCVFQTIVAAMTTLTPPIPLGNPGNEFRLEYVKSIAPLSDFEYTEVPLMHIDTRLCPHTVSWMKSHCLF